MEQLSRKWFQRIEASPILTRIHFVLWFLFVGYSWTFTKYIKKNNKIVTLEKKMHDKDTYHEMCRNFRWEIRV